jgi:hypothetical protein
MLQVTFSVLRPVDSRPQAIHMTDCIQRYTHQGSEIAKRKQLATTVEMRLSRPSAHKLPPDVLSFPWRI